MKWIALAVLGCSMVASAQTAKVVQLTPAEATQAKALRDERVTIEKKQTEFDQAISKKYTTEEATSIYICGDSGGCVTGKPNKYDNHYTRTKDGWNLGFVYSEDFKFIVPKTYTPQPSSTVWGNTIGCPTFTTNTTIPLSYSVQ